MVDGKFRIIPFGWESDFAKTEQARIGNDGSGIGKRSLLQYATGELEQLRTDTSCSTSWYDTIPNFRCCSKT